MTPELAQVGPRLRALRQARGWTLEELSTRAGMSVSTLSRLESGKRQVSLELLLPLTRQLGTTVDDVVSPAAPDPRVRRPVIRRDGLVIVPLAPSDSPVHTYRITYPPTRAQVQLRSHDGYEWLYVVSGKLRLIVGERDLVLGAGEAAEFDTRIPHHLSSNGSRPATVISICNESGLRMHTHAPGVLE